MNELQVFQNSEFGELGVLEIEGKPYFPATACARILGYSNPRKAIIDHCKEDGVTKRDAWVQTGIKADGSPAMRQNSTNFISEGNLYRLIVSSKLPSAERFERWVFDEVLPSIRKTGSYGQIDVAAIITQTATAVCTEMVKQLAPLFQSIARPQAFEERMELEERTMQRSQFRKKPASIIDRLCPELRREVEGMLCDGRHTYSEVAARLRQDGIRISIASICRYAQRTGCYATYEVSSEM